MFAVIKTGGKQYRVAADDLVEIDRIDGEAGASVTFTEVLAVGGGDPVVGTPTVAGASVVAEVVEQSRKPKVIAFKKRRRKNSRRKRGHRQQFTLVKITEILADAPTKRKPAAKPKSENTTDTATAADPAAAPVSAPADTSAAVETPAGPGEGAGGPAAKASGGDKDKSD